MVKNLKKVLCTYLIISCFLTCGAFAENQNYYNNNLITAKESKQDIITVKGILHVMPLTCNPNIPPIYTLTAEDGTIYYLSNADMWFEISDAGKTFTLKVCKNGNYSDYIIIDVLKN
ncbi:MAG: hypothetical protein N2448_10915 [Caloramator sp.]|nr:hypothetical protein [Caloramator sp.]